MDGGVRCCEVENKSKLRHRHVKTLSRRRGRCEEWMEERLGKYQSG